MNVILLILFGLNLNLMAQGQSGAFIIQINDRNFSVVAPEKARALFSVIIDNQSLSDQVGRFTAGNKILKHVSVKSGTKETVEIENKTSLPVKFVPFNPAFQDVELTFGKKTYEIPSKE